MLDVERRDRIARFIEQQNGASVGEISRQFGISEATARRDLVQLSRLGLIERAHGGAVPRRMRQAQGFPDPPVTQRVDQQREQKQRIAQRAAELVQDGDAILLGGGSTTAEMVPFLSDKQNVTVVTNALLIAASLAPLRSLSVIVLGGKLRHQEYSLLGALMEDMLASIRVDKLFLGASALHVDYGLSAEDMDEVHGDRLLMAAARETIVLVDYSKFGKIATVRVAPIGRVHRVITDDRVPSDELELLRDQGLVVDVA